MILNLPLFFIMQYDEDAHFCMEHWSNEWLSKAYSILWLFLAGIIPVMMMAALYSRVVYAMWLKDEENNPKNARQVGTVKTYNYRVATRNGTTNRVSAIKLFETCKELGCSGNA